MLTRSRLAAFGAIASLLFVTGCPAAKVKVPTSSNAEDSIAGNGLKADLSQTSGLAGSVQLPSAMLSGDGAKMAYQLENITSYKPCVGANVSVVGVNLKSSDQTGSGKTDAQGKFSFKPVPANNVWIVKADFGGVTLASMGVPIVKKTVSVKIDLATTLATAGIWPLFKADAKPKPYLMNDVDITKFQALVDAVDKPLQDTTSIKPKKNLADTTNDFGTLMNATPAIRTAYDAIVADLKKKAELRQLGRGNEISAPQNTVPSSSVTDTTGTDGTGTTASTPPRSFNPTMGTLTEIVPTGGSIKSVESLQMLKVTINSLEGLAIPDDSQLVFVSAAGGQATVFGSSALGGVNFSSARSLAQIGTKIYTVAVVNGAMCLLGINVSSQPFVPDAPIPLKLPNNAASISASIASLVVKDTTTLLALDQAHNVVYSLDVAGDGTCTPVAGVFDMRAPDSTVTKAPATSFKLNSPRSMFKIGTNIFIADSGDNQVLQYDPTAAEVKRVAGNGATSATLTSGPLLSTATDTPVSLFGEPGGASKLFVASSTRFGIQVVDLANDSITTLATADHPDGASLVLGPTSVGAYSVRVYVIAGQKLYEYIPN